MEVILPKMFNPNIPSSHIDEYKPEGIVPSGSYNTKEILYYFFITLDIT